MRPLKNVQTKDYIADAVRREIMSGNIEPGEELAQEALGEMLGVSRMPVREALQSLVLEGFARRLPNRHIQAVVPDAGQIHEIFRMFAVMETEDIRMIITGEKDSAELGAVLDDMEKAPDTESKAECEKEFHRIVLRLPENLYLEQMQMKFLEGYAFYAMENLGDKEQIRTVLRRLVEAVQGENVEEAGKILDKYYGQYADEFAEMRKKGGRP